MKVEPHDGISDLREKKKKKKNTPKSKKAAISKPRRRPLQAQNLPTP